MSGSVRRATNAGVSPVQWTTFSTVWIANWKVFFSADGDDLAYTDHPDQIPDHHKMWVKVFRDSLSDALEFNTRASHLMYETWNVPDCLKFFAEKVKLAIGQYHSFKIACSSYLLFFSYKCRGIQYNPHFIAPQHRKP